MDNNTNIDFLNFDDAAEKTAHHPELAAALQRFASKRRA